MELKNENQDKQQKANNKTQELKKKWLMTSAASMTLIGAGLCFFSEAAFAKHDGASFGNWFVMGTLSLVLVNAGIAIFGNATSQKSYIDSRKRLASKGFKRRKYNGPRNKNTKKDNSDS